MPQPAPDPNDPAVVQALLQRLGYGAYNGNYRLAPLSSSPATGDANGAAPVPPSTGAAPTGPQGVPNDGSVVNGPTENPDGSLTDPNTGQNLTPQQAQMQWPDWRPFAAGAGGAAMGLAAAELAKRGRVPTVEGQLMEPGQDIVTGDNTPYAHTVTDPLTPGDVPDSAKVLAGRKSSAVSAPPKQLTDQRVPVKDAGLTHREINQANAIADELVASRLRGKGLPKGVVGRGGASSGPLNRDSLLESVITAIKKAKIPASTLRKAIP